jgi:hypothetical protein
MSRSLAERLYSLSTHPDWGALSDAFDSIRAALAEEIEAGADTSEYDPVQVLRTLGVVRSKIGAAAYKDSK